MLGSVCNTRGWGGEVFNIPIKRLLINMDCSPF